MMKAIYIKINDGKIYVGMLSDYMTSVGKYVVGVVFCHKLISPSSSNIC